MTALQESEIGSLKRELKKCRQYMKILEAKLAGKQVLLPETPRPESPKATEILDDIARGGRSTAPEGWLQKHGLRPETGKPDET